MCAIICSNNLSRFEVLYEANVQRGNFASGIMCLTDDLDQYVLKIQGSIDFDKIHLDSKSKYYIGHVQAPTSANREWSYDTSHPFESLSWSVVHNGVLTNWQAIRARYINWDVNPVDTAVIPNLLQQLMEECKGECPAHEVIKMVLEKLEGTFAVCIVDTDNNEVYIARQGSILHYNDKGDVSTLPGKDFKLLPEGIIMNLSEFSSWKEINKFKPSSPFLFI